MKRRYLIPLVASAAVIAVPWTVAHAHNFNHTVGCGGLSWSATLYNAQETNTIVVTIDGVPVYSDPSFGTTDTGSRTWTQTTDHTWSIVINAPGTTFDHNRSGRQAACQPPATTTTTTTQPSTTTSTTTAATTTSPPTTTTAPTTTTVGEVSSTTQPPASSTSTTPTTLPAPTTSIPNPTDPTVPPTTPPSVARALPETGTASDLMFGVAAGLFLAGCAAMGFARRRT